MLQAQVPEDIIDLVLYLFGTVIHQMEVKMKCRLVLPGR